MAVDTLILMPKGPAEILRAAIRKSGLSAMQICRETGVAQPTITEFLRGKDIKLKTAEALMKRFGLVIKHRVKPDSLPKPKRAGRPKKRRP